MENITSNDSHLLKLTYRYYENMFSKIALVEDEPKIIKTICKKNREICENYLFPITAERFG